VVISGCTMSVAERILRLLRRQEFLIDRVEVFELEPTPASSF
jgi:hypothetical protein